MWWVWLEQSRTDFTSVLILVPAVSDLPVSPKIILNNGHTEERQQSEFSLILLSQLPPDKSL